MTKSGQNSQGGLHFNYVNMLKYHRIKLDITYIFEEMSFCFCFCFELLFFDGGSQGARGV